MNYLWGKGGRDNYGGVEYWHSPERVGWLMKQGGGTRQKLPNTMPNLLSSPITCT